MEQTKRFLALGMFVLAGAVIVHRSPQVSRAQASQNGPSNCCGPTHPVAPRELDFPYYSLKGGFTSTLNLVSDSPAPLQFTLSVHARSGQTLVAAPMTIESQAKLPIDMAALLKSLGADVTGDFSEGSVSLNFVGTIMPLVGQMTITNPALRLVHESEMVENDPGRSDIPAVLDGLWWGLSGGRDAQFMVTNMSNLRASADVFLDFSGARHPSVQLDFRPHETKTVSITQLLSGLNASPATAPEGGITIIQRELQPTLIAQGKVLDPATGFSTTLSFSDPARERSNALHASGVPIGTPTKDSPFAGTGYFIPHVVLRNMTGAPQTVTVTVEYPARSGWDSTGGVDTAASVSPADLTGQFALAPVSIAPYTSLDYSLDSVMSQLPLPLPYCSIRIQYSGAPGTALAHVASVEQKSEMVIDATVANEGDVWHGSGANPWHLDNETESVLFLTDESDQPARIGLSVTAGGIHYYLTQLQLQGHETRAINLRKLRDAQQPDFRQNVIPAGATDGAVDWIRLDNVPVTGRLVVMQRHRAMASNYDCNTCPCPGSFANYLYLSPSSLSLVPGFTASDASDGEFTNCNDSYYYSDVTSSASWSVANTSIASVVGSGQIQGVSAGSTTVNASYYGQTCTFMGYYCTCSGTSGSGSGPVSVASATISSAQSIKDGGNGNFSVTAHNGTPSSYAWSFTAPPAAVNNPKVNFNPSNSASTTTDGHWFALPNDPCKASFDAVYNIISTVTFPGLTTKPQTTLTVNAYWYPAGQTPSASISGGPLTAFNSSKNLWVVVNQGTLARNLPTPTIFVPSGSQFYSKTVAHENRHLQQWNTGGIFGDLLQISSLMAILSPLTGSTQADLASKLNTASTTWFSSQETTYNGRLPAAETDAHAVSDPISPQYLYQAASGCNPI